MKKNSSKIYLLSFALVTLIAAGCSKDFLDTNPTNSADDAALFSTTGNAQNIINGVYRYMFDRFNAQNMPGQGGLMINNDFMGEDLHQAAASWYTSGSNGTGNWVTHRNDNSAWVQYAFRFYYRIIGNVNAILDNIDKAEGPETEKTLLKAEAYGVRAWAYFHLVQYFGQRYDASTDNSQLGVSMPLSAGDLNLPRSTVKDVYTQIISDLENSIAEFNKGVSPADKSHFSINAAKAIRARVALTMQDYPTAITFANEVISSGKFSLMSPTLYKAGFNDASNPEWIWAAIIIPDQGDTFGSYFAQISWNGNTSYIRGVPKRINSALYALIPDNDVRKTMWEPAPNATNFPLPASTYARATYMSRKFKTKDQANTLGDVPYIRLSEMYLIVAEAQARKTPADEAAARQALLDFEKTRNPDAVLSASSGQTLIDEVLVQKRVEYWGEGFRFFDLKRLNQPLDRTVVPNYVSASVADLMKVPAGDPRWQWAIPLGEIQSNPNTAPNP